MKPHTAATVKRFTEPAHVAPSAAQHPSPRLAGAATFSRDSDWQHAPRQPLERCARCGGLWLGGGGVHAPHYRNNVLVGCDGLEVES